MTLIVVIPTVAGLVVAADSRLTLYDPNWIVACDNVFKISEVESVDRTVVFTTVTPLFGPSVAYRSTRSVSTLQRQSPNLMPKRCL